MKIKRTKSLLYVFSSVMVLGLSLLSFDAPQALNQEITPPSPSNTIQNPKQTATPTMTPTFTPTPTPSAIELNVAIEIQPAQDEIGMKLTEQMTSYLQEKYSDPKTNVKEISNITCYYKKGLSIADYILYVCYDIKYIGSNVLIPTLEEYCVSMQEDTMHILSAEIIDEQQKEALLLARRDCISVRNLYIKETIRRYMNAKLACDEILLAELVTDSSSINIKDISTKTQYIEKYDNLQFLILEFPEHTTEADFIVYVANDVKIVNISTLAPGMDEHLIKLNDDNYPQIFYGTTTYETDTYRAWSREQQEYKALYNDVEQRLQDAISNDLDLAEFIGRISNATNSSSEQ